MKISCYTGGMVETNSYLIESSAGSWLIDAAEGVADWLAEADRKIDALILTHQHYDHVMDASILQQAGVKIFAHQAYSQELTLEKAARAWGMPLRVSPYVIDAFLVPGEPLDMAGECYEVFHVPGHSVDSLTIYHKSQCVLFSGDTLFAGSVGRSDLPGGNSMQLIDEITEKLLGLPADVKVYPGHGPSTTIGREMAHNPFLN